MRQILISLILFSLPNAGFSQTFLKAYQKYRLEKVDTLSYSKTRNKIKRFVKSQIIELDTVFQSYNAKYNFDFNTADTLFLIYDTPAESPFTSDIIIWSGMDTISYKQGFEYIKPGKNKRVINYHPFVEPHNESSGLNIKTERDSVITLVSNRDFDTINHLGDNHNINGGSWVDIYIAYKVNGQYYIESCHPKQFFIWTTNQNN